MIRLEAVTKRYGDLPVDETAAPAAPAALAGLSLEVAPGEACALVGPSGCGKTTTLKLINRLVEPTSGRVLVDGRDVAGVDPVTLRRGIGYVIQQVGLFPHQSVADNVATVPRLLGWDRARIRHRVGELLELVGLDPATFAARRPDELSGGQRQRVGVARALAADPPVLLMDEPFGAVDPVTRLHLQETFVRLQAELRKTVVLVTHDIGEALRLGDRLAVLSDGGVLEQHAAPDEVLARPASTFVAEFVGRDRVLRRLAFLPVGAALAPAPAPGASPPAATLASSADLGQAVGALLTSEHGWVRVVDGDRTLGSVTLASIQAALAGGDAPAGP